MYVVNPACFHSKLVCVLISWHAHLFIPITCNANEWYMIKIFCTSIDALWNVKSLFWLSAGVLEFKSLPPDAIPHNSHPNYISILSKWKLNGHLKESAAILFIQKLLAKWTQWNNIWRLKRYVLYFEDIKRNRLQPFASPSLRLGTELLSKVMSKSMLICGNSWVKQHSFKPLPESSIHAAVLFWTQGFARSLNPFAFNLESTYEYVVKASKRLLEMWNRCLNVLAFVLWNN